MQKFNEVAMRPTTLAEYEGQDKIRKALSFYIKAAKLRGDCLDHTIIYGPSGLGKTTLANIISNEMEANLLTVSAPTIKTTQDMISILMVLNEGMILFIDEIHRLPKKVEEVLYFAMEDFVVDTEVDGVRTRTELAPFTLIGATTAKGMLSEPLRNRFQISLELIPYQTKSLTDIVIASAGKLGGVIDRACAEIIASRSRGVPRIANGFVRRVQDFALVNNNGVITEDVVNEAFDFLGVDSHGLTEQDLRYLGTMAKVFQMKTVGIDTLCSALNDDKTTIERTVEPYLIQKGYVRKTPRGRMLTEEGYKIGKKVG